MHVHSFNSPHVVSEMSGPKTPLVHVVLVSPTAVNPSLHVICRFPVWMIRLVPGGVSAPFDGVGIGVHDSSMIKYKCDIEQKRFVMRIYLYLYARMLIPMN